MSTTAPMSLDLSAVVTGKLHCVVAFDWCEEINLEQAAKLVPSESSALPRRRRTPSTIAYRPPPLRFNLPPVRLALPHLADCQAEVEAILFDFGAANIAFRIPFSLSMQALPSLAASFAEPEWLVKLARSSGEPLFHKLHPALKDPLWSDLFEEYFVFQFDPANSLEPAAKLVQNAPDWLAAILLLDDGPLSDEEIAEALRQRISYRPGDIVLMEWAAAVVIDSDCDETLHTIEFANLQLLEFRYIDQKVGDALLAAQRLIEPAARSWLPLWRTNARPLRVLNEMRIDAVGTFERANGVLQLLGDQYLSRLYRMLASRFHLDQWAENIRRSLDVTEGVHQTLSSQAATYRLELLEIIVVLLILMEIILAFVLG